MSLREKFPPSLFRSLKLKPDSPAGAVLQTATSALRANPALATTALIAAVAGPLLARIATANYRAWMALDPGGLPRNPLGYLVNAVLRPLARFDTRVPAPYDRAALEALYGPEAFVPYYHAGGKAAAPPPHRAGPRPEVPGFVAPQRQTTQVPGDGAKSGEGGPALPARQAAYLTALAGANPSLFKTAPSAAEGGHHTALWLADSGVAWAARARGRGRAVLGLGSGLKGELAHPHGEGSAHMVLGLADAEALIARGWAERHPLSGGRAGVLPWGYVLVYAPRDDAEFAVWSEVLLAGARFVAAAVGWEGEVVVPE